MKPMPATPRPKPSGSSSTGSAGGPGSALVRPGARLLRATSSPRTSARPSSRVVLVRQPVRSVRKTDEQDRGLFKLFIGVLVVLGVMTAVWLIGQLGWRLGFAPAMRVPELACSFDTALAAGAAALVSVPRVIIIAGMSHTFLMMVGFLFIAIPAAAHSAIKQYTPGGPRVPTIVQVASFTGAITAMITALLLVWWTASQHRVALMGELPLQPRDVGVWIENLETAAGLDALATIAMALWAVLTMRLVLPTWMKSLAACFSFFSLAIIIVAMSISTVTASQAHLGRSLALLNDEADNHWRLVIGATRHQTASMLAESDSVIVETRDQPSAMQIVGKQSIVEFLDAAKPQQEN
jgi:hypothetical protein